MASPTNNDKQKWGQHSIEYIILLTLIMAGIIIMGRYVVRSWNANLKGWEDSAEDSLTDPLTEGDISFPGCDPRNWVDVACGVSIADYCNGTNFICSPTEMLVQRTYTPSNCNCAITVNPPEYLRCRVDTCCCTAPVWTGLCASQAITPPGPAQPSCNTQMIPKNSDNTCPEGTGEHWVLCGDDVDPDGRRYGCFANSACENICLTPPFIGSAPKYGDYCTDDLSYVPLGGIVNTFVNEGSCTPGRKCEVECGPGYWALGTSPDDYCDTCGTMGIKKTGCTVPDTFDLGGCTSPTFKPCCYAP